MLQDTSSSFVDSQTYRIISKIGEGDIGIVYLTDQFGADGFRKTVALKLVSPKVSREHQVIRRFIEEARQAANLAHENIAQLYYLGNSGTQPYVAVEHVSGPDLEAFTQTPQEGNSALTPDLVTFIISRVCRALDYAHSKLSPDAGPLGMFHGGLTPRNILISDEGVVKVTDFGINKRRLLGPAKGTTSRYVAAEQACQEGIGRHSDLFSLGAIMFELLDGAKNHLLDKPNLPPDVGPALDTHFLESEVPKELVAVLRKSLHRDPHSRYQSAGEMGFDLEYSLYHDRFGPTNETLAHHLRNISSSSPVGSKSDLYGAD